MARRRNNEGSISYETARDSYKALLYLDDGRRISKRFKSESDAKNWLDDQRYMLRKGKFIEPSSITLGDWLLEYLEVYAQGNIRQRTYERYLSLVNHITTIAETKVQEFTPHALQRLYAEEMGHLSGETRKKVHNLISLALDQAVANKIIDSNPLKSVKPPKVVREEVETFEKKELAAILKAASGHRNYLVVKLAAETGMRLSELTGLRWMDVEIENNALNVNQTLHYSDTKGYITEAPKSKHSKRRITFPSPTMDLIKKMKPEAKKQADGKDDDADVVRIGASLVFTAENGSPMHPSNFERWWLKTQELTIPECVTINEKISKLTSGKRRGTPEYKEVIASAEYKALIAEKQKLRKKFHALRHTHATWLLAAGVPLIDVSRRLGHSKPSITLDLYGHAMPKLADGMGDRVQEIYSLDIETK